MGESLTKAKSIKKKVGNAIDELFGGKKKKRKKEKKEKEKGGKKDKKTKKRKGNSVIDDIFG